MLYVVTPALTTDMGNITISKLFNWEGYFDPVYIFERRITDNYESFLELSISCHCKSKTTKFVSFTFEHRPPTEWVKKSTKSTQRENYLRHLRMLFYCCIQNGWYMFSYNDKQLPRNVSFNAVFKMDGTYSVTMMNSLCCCRNEFHTNSLYEPMTTITSKLPINDQ